MSEMVVLVDAQDQQIGLAEKMAAHQQGLLHRAFSIFVIRRYADMVEILMQQRKNDKYHCGALWTNTCCSHPRAHEDLLAAGERRLQEEMGLHIKLQALSAFTYRAEFANGLIEHEYDHVLIGLYNDEPININTNEVEDYLWMSLDELQLSLEQNPAMYTPWLQPALTILQANLDKYL